MAIDEQVALAAGAPCHRSGIDVAAQPRNPSELGLQAPSYPYGLSKPASICPLELCPFLPLGSCSNFFPDLG